MRYWGDDPDYACGYANIYDLSSKKKNNFDRLHHVCNDGYGKTSPVGSFKENDFGVKDMIGNVWEWCAYMHGKYYYSRGGGYDSSPERTRVAARSGGSPAGRSSNLGFRLVLIDR